MSSDEFLTLSQVAGRLNIRERVIQRYVDSGVLRSIKIGRQVRYRWHDVEAWVEAMATKHPATMPVTPPVNTRHQTVPDNPSTPVIPFERGANRHKVAPEVQQRH